jgi:hypothetical protein
MPGSAADATEPISTLNAPSGLNDPSSLNNLSNLLGHLDFVPVSNAVVYPEPRMTLRPAGPAAVVVRKEAARG